VPRFDHEVIGQLIDPGQDHLGDLDAEPMAFVAAARI
jgi:hypothetical protein